MNDDEFMKELEEVTKDLEKEYNAVKPTTNNTQQSQSLPNMSSYPSFDPNMMNMQNLFQNFDFGNDSNNIAQLKKLFSEFDDGDPESQEMIKKISKLLFNVW